MAELVVRVSKAAPDLCPSASRSAAERRGGFTHLLGQATCVFVSLTVLFGGVGCTHAISVKNLDAYHLNANAPEKMVVLLQDRSGSDTESEYFESVHKALMGHPSVAGVVVGPYVPPGFVPNIIVDVDPSAQYRGSGLNYLIAFPGFLLFTHAWNGYIYSADLKTSISVRRPDETTGIEREISTPYDMRQCDFERGAWTSSGWWLPGLGATNLIVGGFMVPYDTDTTPEFQKAISHSYGEYIANSIVQAAAELGPPQKP